MSDPRLLSLLAIAVLVILSAFFSAAEAALLAISRLRVLQRTQDDVGKSLSKLLDDRNRYLTTVLVGNTIVLLSADSIATWLAIQEGIVSPVLIATVVMALLVLIFAEILPKMIAVQDPMRWAPRLAWFLHAMAVVLSPVTTVLVAIASFIIRLFGGDPKAQGPYVTEEDIRALVSAGEEHGAIEEEEKEMIHSIFELSDTAVSEVMTPRIDIVCADADAAVSAGVDLAIKEGYSKLPVYEGNIDHILGVVHVRELLIALSRGDIGKRLRELMRSIKAIPETKKVDELLREMQAEKVSVAIVVDEYGGTAGLVTMEDVLEEIVGEIMDEYDVAEHDRPAEIKHLADGEAVVDARMRIADVNEELGLHLPTEDYESIGGYAFGQFGRVPLPGDAISLGNGDSLIVEETAGRRLRSVRIKKAQSTNGAAATAQSERGSKPLNGFF
ncbi:MAG: HlyC/CorC family transporter [Candidatus Eremiobacteraeota bacterium]|nr:HlyC/CorC family transporter [Candidatus Eremiobacteraeota bacterium]